MNKNIKTNEDDEILKNYYSRYGGFWEYPEMLDYCYLVNPYFNRSKIIDEMQNNFRTLVSEYPAGMAVNSKLASKCWNVKEEYIIPGNGAAELIKALMETLEGKVGIVRPTFEEYPNRLPDEQVVTFVPHDESFRYGADDMIDFFGSKHVDTILLINPDNPSGNFIPMLGVHKLAQWRLGILCSADIALVAKMKRLVSIWNINSFAEFFMQIYPKYRKDYDLACEQFIKAREDFEDELVKITFLRVMPSQANYFFLEVLPPYKPKELCAILLKEYNILASACLAKKGIEPNKYMRIAIRNHGDNAKFIAAMRELIK